MELLFAALEYGINNFTDFDISILCCVCSDINRQLYYTLDRRLYANECKIRGNRYRLLNELDDTYFTNLQVGDIIYNKHSTLAMWYHGNREIIYINYNYEYMTYKVDTCLENETIEITSRDKYRVLIPPRTDII
jgi:hypothetical protein